MLTYLADVFPAHQACLLSLVLVCLVLLRCHMAVARQEVQEHVAKAAQHRLHWSQQLRVWVHWNSIEVNQSQLLGYSPSLKLPRGLMKN
jgi:hypothetical protein